MQLQNRTELARHFADLGFNVGAEVGVADGRYSEILCQQIPDLKLYSIDPWDVYNIKWRTQKYQNKAFEIAKKRLAPYNAILIKKTSVEASYFIDDNSLDFVFIDGVHSYDHVMEDIITWNRKVKKGGIISGHDYYKFLDHGVIHAVDDYTRHHKIKFNLTKRYTGGHKDDTPPCWWWVK